MSHELPRFPAWSPLTVDLFPAIRDAVAGEELYSDVNPVSMYCWDTGDLHVSSLHGNLVVQIPSYTDQEEQLLTFFGTREVVATASELLAAAPSLGVQAALSLIAEPIAHHLRDAGFHVEEDMDHHDYILSTADHAQLSGRTFKKRRNMIVRCQNLARVSTSLSYEVTPELRSQVEIITAAWAKKKEEEGRDPTADIDALDRLWECAPSADMLFFVLFANGAPAAFSITERVSPDMVLVHFEKTDYTVPGLGAVLLHEVSKELQAIDIPYMNIEQDLGIVGMRHNKQLRRPTRYLKKYKVTSGGGV